MTELRQVVSVLIGLALGGGIGALRPAPILKVSEVEVPPCVPNATVFERTNELEAVALKRLRRSTEAGIRIRPAPSWPEPSNPTFEPESLSLAFREQLGEGDWNGLDCREYPCVATLVFTGDHARSTYRAFSEWLKASPYAAADYLVEERVFPGGFGVSVSLPEQPLSRTDLPRVRFRLVESTKQAFRGG